MRIHTDNGEPTCTYSVTQTSEARTNLRILAQQQLIPRRPSHTHSKQECKFPSDSFHSRWACQREPLRWAQTQTDVTFPQNEASLVLMNEHTHWAWILPASMGWQTMHVASSRICHSLLPVSNPSCHIRATEATRTSRAATRALWVIYHIFVLPVHRRYTRLNKSTKVQTRGCAQYWSKTRWWREL